MLSHDDPIHHFNIIILFSLFILCCSWVMVLIYTNSHVSYMQLYYIQVYIIEYYLFSDFRNYDNVLRAKIISSLSHQFQAMNVH